MSVDRLKRVNELLKREIADVIFRLMAESGFDLSAVTVTQVETSRNLRNARVSISIRDHAGERDRMLSQLRSRRVDIQKRINKDLTLKYTPRLHFALDESVERGDRVLGILANLDPVPDVSGESDAVPDPAAAADGNAPSQDEQGSLT